MNKQTIEVLEETKTSLNKHFSQWGDTELTINPVLDDVLSTAIQALKALESAEKVLGEKRKVDIVAEEGTGAYDRAILNNGFNIMHDIAKPIIAQRDLRLKELNTKILEMGYEAIADGKRIAELEKSTGEIIQDILIQSRDIEKVCSSCLGWGIKAYGDTSTWGKGIGGQMMTSDVCDKCWGSGDESKPWKSWKELQSGKLRQQSEEKDKRIEELSKYEWEMRKQLSYLTPQGSEFTEFEECYNYIKEQLREGHEAKKQVVYERRELQSTKQELSQLKGKLSRESLKKVLENLDSNVVKTSNYYRVRAIQKECGIEEDTNDK